MSVHCTLYKLHANTQSLLTLMYKTESDPAVLRYTRQEISFKGYKISPCPTSESLATDSEQKLY